MPYHSATKESSNSTGVQVMCHSSSTQHIDCGSFQLAWRLCWVFSCITTFCCRLHLFVIPIRERFSDKKTMRWPWLILSKRDSLFHWFLTVLSCFPFGRQKCSGWVCLFCCTCQSRQKFTDLGNVCLVAPLNNRKGFHFTHSNAHSKKHESVLKFLCNQHFCKCLQWSLFAELLVFSIWISSGINDRDLCTLTVIWQPPLSFTLILLQHSSVWA